MGIPPNENRHDPGPSYEPLHGASASGTLRRGTSPPGRGHGVSSGHSQAHETERAEKNLQNGNTGRGVQLSVGLITSGGKGGKATVAPEARDGTGKEGPT